MMSFKEWFKENIVESVTNWIFGLLFITVTVLLIVDKITGDQYLIALPILAGIALSKRAVTQAIRSNGGGK